MDLFVGAAYVRTMAAYNSGMNRRLYAAAARLDEAARRADRGAFWGSIHATLCHLLWGDQLWMSRFDGGERPAVGQADSGRMIADFMQLHAARLETDKRMDAWAAGVDDEWLRQDLTWFSGSAQRSATMPRGFLAAHLFNHQTHHRGQVHAMITAAGERMEDTDLILVAPPPG